MHLCAPDSSLAVSHPEMLRQMERAVSKRRNKEMSLMDLTGMIIDYTRERIADPIDKSSLPGSLSCGAERRAGRGKNWTRGRS